MDSLTSAHITASTDITDDALTDHVYCIYATVPTVRLMDGFRYNYTHLYIECVTNMTDACKIDILPCNCTNGETGITDSEIN